MDVQPLLDRIGFDATAAVDRATLGALQEAHLRSVPFDALDCRLGNRVTVQPRDAYRKVVEHRRGGFCFELNGLFAWLLDQLGFDVQRVAARPLLASGGLAPPLAHLALVVALDRRWLVDVGFGFPWSFAPLDVDAREPVRASDGRTFAVRDDGDALVAEQLDAPERNGYRFTLEPVTQDAFAARCHDYATNPESPFVRMGTVARPAGDGWAMVTRRRVTAERQGRRVVDRELADEADWRAELRRRFGYVVDGRDVRVERSEREHAIAEPVRLDAPVPHADA